MEQFKKTKRRANSIDILIAKNLKERRRMLGMSRDEVAKIVDVSIQQIEKYENAKNRISSSTLYCLAQALKVPMNYFVDLEHAPEFWVNEEKLSTIRGGSINIKINGIQLKQGIQNE